jgi:hypothetical protein
MGFKRRKERGTGERRYGREDELEISMKEQKKQN